MNEGERNEQQVLTAVAQEAVALARDGAIHAGVIVASELGIVYSVGGH